VCVCVCVDLDNEPKCNN